MILKDTRLKSRDKNLFNKICSHCEVIGVFGNHDSNFLPQQINLSAI